jgi:PleD family two-component response regulator
MKAIQLEQSLIDRGLPLRFNISIKIVSLRFKQNNLDVLIARADNAVYLDKNAGRNQVKVAVSCLCYW